MSRVAIFHPSFKTRGGAEFLCANQARRLVRNGHHVRLVTFRFDHKIWGDELTGVEVVVVRERQWTDAVFNWNRRTKLLARGRRAHKALQDVDLIVAHNYPSTLMLGKMDLASRRVWYCHEPPRGLHLRLANPYLSARVQNAPPGDVDFATSYWRDILVGSSPGKEAAKRSKLVELDIAAVQQLDGVCANSEYSRSNALAIYGDVDVKVVHPFVRFAEGNNKAGALGKEGLQVLVQTRLEWLKNVDSVIRGFAVYSKGDPNAVLHVVGEGEARDKLMELARELMPAAACQFHGYLSNEGLNSMYERCDVFALLTVDEPFGMVYPEAAARGLHIIGPDHGGPFEILEGGGLGHCIDPFEPEALAEALDQLRGLSATEADQKRAAADRSCRARFSEERIEGQLFEAFGLERGASNRH